MLLRPGTQLPEGAKDWSDTARIWEWACQSTELHGYTFDHKFLTGTMHLHNGVGKVGYAMASPNPEMRKRPADLYILKYQNVENKLVILPRAIYFRWAKRLSTLTYTEGWAIPAGLKPFEIDSSSTSRDLLLAISCLFKAPSTQSGFVNPTTSLRYRGYRPRATTEWPLKPDGTTSIVSINSIRNR